MLRRETTFPRIFAHLSRRAEAPRRAIGPRRAFTLLELMVVVVIITIVSTIAIPGVVKRMKSNRTRQAAEDLAMTFRQARIRAMGRASAVLVRYDSVTGSVELREAIQGGNAIAPGCERRPESSCMIPADRWDTNRSQRLELTDYIASGDFNLEAESGGVPVAALDICFAPSGRSYLRNTAASATPFNPWTAPVRFDINRNDGVGFQRSVLVTPTGNARVVAAP